MKNIDKNELISIQDKIKEFKQSHTYEMRDKIVSDIYKNAKSYTDQCVKKQNLINPSTKEIDDIVTSKIFGIPLMIVLLTLILWITIQGANYPSALLADLLFSFEDNLSIFLYSLNTPVWLHNILVFGLYKTVAWVVSVMLPPMAIFFPIFTLLEDLGYLPRVSFNLDHVFEKACAHGKQALTMCMGFGCNAAGIIACRIIDSPRERLIAILTNNFVPCNGRFPTLIVLATIFIGVETSSGTGNILASLLVVLMIMLGIGITLLTSYILSKTLLKGIPSSFTLELPPYRKPQILRVLYSSLIDRTIFVLGRAVTVAAPAGVITYVLSNIYIGDMSIVGHIAGFLNPFAHLIGLDGFILMAFILGFPANEIVLPILIMAYLSKGIMMDFQNISQLHTILVDNGWTYLTTLNVMLFSLLHFPCATTVWTIRKETGSVKWTLLSFFIPTAIAICICFLTTQIWRVISLVM
ncbi:ferrous iron transporter B [Clostridium sp. ZS2-4]|nr:ferrous iron transporter B [Clostridium sp. ZS2-4]